MRRTQTAQRDQRHRRAQPLLEGADPQRQASSSIGSRPRKTDRQPCTSTTRRCTQRRALEKSAAAGRHSQATALMLRRSADAATASALARLPGRRAARQSGKALNVR